MVYLGLGFRAYVGNPDANSFSTVEIMNKLPVKCGPDSRDARRVTTGFGGNICLICPSLLLSIIVVSEFDVVLSLLYVCIFIALFVYC